MPTTFKVRVWSIVTNKRAKGSTYTVRWKLEGRRYPCKETFPQYTPADSFRSALVSAAKSGEAFDLDTGLPVSMKRADKDMAWFEFAVKYVDSKWPRAAATSRRSIAEAMMTVTCAMVSNKRGKPDDKLLRSALFNWAFNTEHRDNPARPEKVTAALRWIASNTRNVSTLTQPAVLRPVMDALAQKVDGKGEVAATVVNRKRAVFHNALEYAIELEAIAHNPIPKIKWTAPKVEHEVDPAVAASPVQAGTLLEEVKKVQRSGERLMACYACTYYGGLRPEEAVDLREHNIQLPPRTWNETAGRWDIPKNEFGEFVLSVTAPHAGSRWTNTGTVRDKRGLKHRGKKAVRRAPIRPELVAILYWHLDTFGTGDEGRLFRGERGGEVPVRLYNDVYRKARRAAFTPEVYKSPLAETPYDLRHAWVSYLLSIGVEPSLIALWAGHSLEVLFRIYAKLIHGRHTHALDRILKASTGS
ncbi:hypothetical protein SAMN05216188_1486 [Lentzea xinjiangensis]|uniref:Tyr recombinase domain-containing protein n=1 Tax=Lentzea xinjiangensis TaxID=402600 RepID=A0A1H9WW33_9PSEU|nr:hypothetical protein [Lentzea xinjiangensis]SES38126.1 hypothetical protein SAMN05216188_1486 [Lentzea xinjiangensis]